jgi:hypothetical protein
MKRLVLLGALCLWRPDVPPPLQAAHLTLSVAITYAPSMSSRAFKKIVETETAALWRPYGVDVVWTGTSDPRALSLAATVDRAPLRPAVAGRPVLGTAELMSGDAIEPDAPIRISMDAIEAALEERYGAQAMHDYIVAMAVGRVLAHEIGHVLLGQPAYHDRIGLMRPSFPPDDLARYERSRFQLSERSVERLRARIAVLCGHERRPSP